MFNNCSSLETFAYNLSNVTDGRYMFNNCSSLKTFKGSLASLVRRGYKMFYNCKLNKESVQFISETIHEYVPSSEYQSELESYEGIITIHVDKTLPQSDLSEIINYFNNISAKGWSVDTNIPYTYTPAS